VAGRPKVYCCDLAHRCSWARNCPHSRPHRHRKSCNTPCKRKLGATKCVAVELCPRCDGIGYTFRGMRK